ncbi:MAG: hypothetical protein U5Q16_00115 [Gammaproteobacteria bacterium]|nr:hypothetical protein [Gammaproteobacteria bacterium]
MAGTRKGGFILSADGKRKKWSVSGPHFAGWEVYHMNGSPADPDRIYASQTSAWFGQIIQRSDDAGDSWHEVSGNLPSDFGFPIAVHAHEPETVYVVPIESDSLHYPPEGKLRVYRTRGGGHWTPIVRDLPAVLSVEVQTLS